MADSVRNAPKSTLVPHAPVRSGSGALTKRRRYRTPSGIAWILPGFVVAVGIIYFCIGYSGYISLLPWNWRPGAPETIEGFASYVRAFNSPLFWESLQHTVLFFIVAYVVQTTMGIIFAAILHSKVYAATLFKVIIFLPVVIAPAIMAPVHRRVFAVDGPINWILQHIGLIHMDSLGNRDWVGWLSSALTHIGMGNVSPNWIQPSTSVWVIIAVQIWSSVGMAFILFYAAMGQIDPEMLEAARIDGAGNLRVLLWIVVPNVRPTIIALAILNAITSLKLFDFPYLITGGGPAHSSEFLGTYIYSELFGVSSHYGYAATLSVLLLILALGVSIIMSVSSREREPGRKVKGEGV
jgi:raffinose/stachyose/melibiose transport system permease protein